MMSVRPDNCSFIGDLRKQGQNCASSVASDHGDGDLAGINSLREKRLENKNSQQNYSRP